MDGGGMQHVQAGDIGVGAEQTGTLEMDLCQGCWPSQQASGETLMLASSLSAGEGA
jgi:hypothetical protein